jgi:hypothetical protein
VSKLSRFLKQTLTGDDAKALDRRLARLEQQTRAMQRLLLYQQYRDAGLHPPGFDPGAVSLYSQHGEDAFLLRLFAALGAPRKTFLEIGIQDGLECNSANLALNFGWSGVMLEGDPAFAAAAQEHYRAHPNVSVRQAFVTKENVRELLGEAKVDPQADLFSLDIDGNDYWIWEALEDFRPRVVVVEYNDFFGERPITIPYRPEFRHRAKTPRYYCGASLTAYARLAQRRGYALVGGESCNAFFVRKEALRGAVREVAVRDVYRPPEPGARTERIRKALDGLEYAEVQ